MSPKNRPGLSGLRHARRDPGVLAGVDRESAESAGRAAPLVPRRVAARRGAGRRPARPDDAGGEDRPDGPGRARRRRRRPVAHHRALPRQRAVRRRLGADAEHARGLGRHGRPLPAGGARHPARHPAASTASTPCTATATCSARPSSRTTSASAPPATRGWSRRSRHITAEETRASGPQWAFAPCVCVARDDRWGRTYESFGETPDAGGHAGGAAIDGLQGRPRPARRRRPGARHAPSTSPATGSRRTTSRAGDGRRTRSTRASTRSPAQRVRRARPVAVRPGGPASTTSARSCRRSPASTGPRTVSATR